MPVFKVTVKLYYKRSNEDEEFMNVPNLTDDDFNNFIIQNHIKTVFAEEFGFDEAYGTLSDCEYDNDTHNLSFKLMINEDTMFIDFDEDTNAMIIQIKQSLNDISLEDSLYEGVSAAYTIADARDLYPEHFGHPPSDNENFIEIGLIDYRDYDNPDNIMVELVENE